MICMVKRFGKPGKLPLSLLGIALGLTSLGTGTAFAGQINCEKVRTGTEAIRFTMENTTETEVKKPPLRVTYLDVTRNSPDGIVFVIHAGETKFKTTLTRSLLPLTLELLGKEISQTYTYDTDVSTFALKPGVTFTSNVIESPVAGTVSTFAHHEYTVSDGGHFDVAGCSFPVVSVHHTIHYKRDGKEWDFILDSQVSPDLEVAVRTRRQVQAGSSSMESAVYNNVVTDLSTTADMTKDP